MLVLRNIFRLITILMVLYRGGALFLLKDLTAIPNYIINILSIFSSRSRNLSRGKRIKLLLQDLGPFFIKFGQTLATRADIVGDEIAEQLSELQDKVPYVSHTDIGKYIEEEIGKPINELFRKFDKNPVATASIAMVFKAEDLKGNKVAVKILKPGIEKEFAKDIALFFWLARIAERHFSIFKRLRLIEIVEMFAETTNLEMDLRLEAAAASELKDNHKNDSGIYIPQIYWQHTSKRALIMEWIDGTPIYEGAKLKRLSYDLNSIITNFVLMFLNQAYRDGFFHADLHPGNILIMKNGDIALIDFGIMGRLDKKTKIYLAQILKGFLSRDYEYVAKTHFVAGYVPRHKSVGHFSQACRAVGEPIVGLPLNKISVGKLLAHLFKITQDFEMTTQPQLLLIQKTTMVVEGLVMQLNPEVNMWEISEPWIREWSEKNLQFDSRIVNSVSDMIEFFNNDLKEFFRHFIDTSKKSSSHPRSH